MEDFSLDDIFDKDPDFKDEYIEYTDMPSINKRKLKVYVNYSKKDIVHIINAYMYKGINFYHVISEKLTVTKLAEGKYILCTDEDLMELYSIKF